MKNVTLMLPIFALLCACGGTEEDVEHIGEEAEALTYTDNMSFTIIHQSSGGQVYTDQATNMSPAHPGGHSNLVYSYLGDQWIRGFSPQGVLEVDGWTSNPGASWLVSLQVGSNSIHTGVGATFTYNSTYGLAQWAWPNNILFPKGGNPTSATIKHN
jgi:hypothetical protein